MTERLNINIGDVINYRYRVIEKLGEGSFGQVFRVEDVKLTYLCAIFPLFLR